MTMQVVGQPVASSRKSVMVRDDRPAAPCPLPRGDVGLHFGPMSRNSGIGLAAFGLVLAAVGAILRLATSVHTSGFNIHKIGDVLLLAGVIIVILGLIIMRTDARRRSRTRT